MTSNDDRAARLAAIRERAAAAMPGPWRWRGNKGSQRIELVSIPGIGSNSLLSVMAFWRWGTQSAQPIFRDDAQIMRKPTWVIPQPWNDWLIGGIDHPDARFIEHSREDIDFLLSETDRLRALAHDLAGKEHGARVEQMRALRAADIIASDESLQAHIARAEAVTRGYHRRIEADWEEDQ